MYIKHEIDFQRILRKFKSGGNHGVGFFRAKRFLSDIEGHP